MQRPIRFRAKRDHWKEFDGWGEWQYANGYYFDGTNYWFILPDKANPALAWTKHIIIDIDTMGQYTGLKNKNGVEIYEGDRVKLDRFNNEEMRGVVEYSNNLASFIVRVSGYRTLEPFPILLIEMGTRTIEVIGNIYEGVKDGESR